MSLQSLIDNANQLAEITVEAPDGQVPSQSPMGGADRSQPWPILASGVPCLVNTRSASLSAFGGAREDARASIFDTRIYFYSDPTPSGFTTRMRITVTQAGNGELVTLGVYAVKSPTNPNSMARIFQVDCERVRTP